MTRIYSAKLVLLLFGCFLSFVQVFGQQWVGIKSSSSSPPVITTTGHIQNSTEVSVEIPGFYFCDRLFEGENFKLPQVPDGHPILKHGSPDLQKLSFSLQLPSNGNVEVTILSSQYVEYTDINIIPSGGNISRANGIGSVSKGVAYKTNSFFPGNLFDSDLPYIVRNMRAQAFQVYPFQYNPVTKVLRFYYQIVLKIENIGGIGDNPLSDIDNSIIPIEGIKAESINAETSLYKYGKLPSERGSMLIICPDKFLDAIAPLVEWRKQTGISTEIVKSEQFVNSEAIYNFIKNYYQNNPSLAYLLLVGDAKQIPPYIYPYGASDNYYSYLAGNDHYPDILVGRFSAEAIKDVEVQVNRTIQYEKDPGKDPSWITSATGIGSILSPGDDGESDFQHIRNLLKDLKTTSYTTGNEFFDGSQGGQDAEGNPSTSDIVAKINKGTGILFYAGHGSSNTMATGSVTVSVVDGLDNYGKYPLIWSAACENGNFVDKYCIAEAWLRATNGKGQPAGAAGVLMASGPQTSFPPMEAQDKIAKILSSPTKEQATMGSISVMGMMSMNNVYSSAGFAITDTWILFGDPSLRVRTAQPKQMHVEHTGTIGSGRTIYTLTCDAADGFACLSANGIILGTANVADGKATLFLDRGASGENMTLTITALNYLPFIEKVTVKNSPGSLEFCTPLNHSKLQPISTLFTWDNGNDGASPEYYLVYLGTDNPPTNLINGQKVIATQLIPQFNFEYDKEYFWKVVSVNKFGINEGKVMDFKTVFKPDEDFEPVFKSRLTFLDGGTQKWSTDGNEHFDGKQSLRSGTINDNEFSSLIYPCQVKSCDFVSFWSKVSSDPGDKLQFIIDGKIIREWSGQVKWTYNVFKVEVGSHELEWRYTKNSIVSAGEDAVWLDNIHLPIHFPATAKVSAFSETCEASDFETSASAVNYFSINWKTDGDGSFNDPNLENAIYKPGVMETKNAKTTLHMLLQGYDGCPVLTKSLQLSINPLPVIALPTDTIIADGSVAELDATISGNVTYEWLPSGSSSALISIDSISSKGGTKSANITITNSKGCAASKDVFVHFNNSAIADTYNIFPNPNNGVFTLEPLKGSATIDKMKLMDMAGKVVWESNSRRDILNSGTIEIPGLTSGLYFLVNENKSGQSYNPLVIQ